MEAYHQKGFWLHLPRRSAEMEMGDEVSALVPLPHNFAKKHVRPNE